MRLRPKKITGKDSDLKGLFFIIKGQYTPNKGVESFTPENSDTKEWYMAMDRVCYNTISCSSDFDKVLHSVATAFKKYRSREEYFRMLGTYTTEDYYRVHYEGLPPYTHEQINNLLGNGFRARTSLPMKELYREVEVAYGDFYKEQIEEIERQVIIR